MVLTHAWVTFYGNRWSMWRIIDSGWYFTPPCLLSILQGFWQSIYYFTVTFCDQRRRTKQSFFFIFQQYRAVSYKDNHIPCPKYIEHKRPMYSKSDPARYMYSCVLYMYLYACYIWFRIALSCSKLYIKNWGSQNRDTFPREKAVTASLNIQLVRIGRVISIAKVESADVKSANQWMPNQQISECLISEYRISQCQNSRCRNSRCRKSANVNSANVENHQMENHPIPNF